MSATILKEEINQTHGTIHNIAQWKIILVTSLAAVALGLTSSSDLSQGPARFPALLLLLAVPFVCAYSDLFYYQNLLRILIIAQFIRTKTEDDTLHRYETFVADARRGGAFFLETFAHIISSAVLSLAPALCFASELRSPLFKGPWEHFVFLAIWTIWLIGIWCIFLLLFQFLWTKAKLFKDQIPTTGIAILLAILLGLSGVLAVGWCGTFR